MTDHRATTLDEAPEHGEPRLTDPWLVEDLQTGRAGPMPGEAQARLFSSCDVHQAAGLSLQQQNYWDQRGVLPHARSGAAGWRRFSLREVFALAISTEIRRRFGVPLAGSSGSRTTCWARAPTT